MHISNFLPDIIISLFIVSDIFYNQGLIGVLDFRVVDNYFYKVAYFQISVILSFFGSTICLKKMRFCFKVAIVFLSMH